MNNDQTHRDCPVSGHELNRTTSISLFGPEGRHWPGVEFDCRHCGKFIVDQIELNHLLNYLNPPQGISLPKQPTKRHRAVLAHALRRMAQSGDTPILKDGMTLRILQEDRLPTLSEQRDKLLQWFGSEVEIGPKYGIRHDGLGARVGSLGIGPFQLMLEGMLSDGLLHGNIGADGYSELGLTHRGLQRLEQLEHASPSGFNAFMAMQFGDAALNRIVQTYFKPAIAATGFNLYRLDDKPEAGLIDARLRNEIRNCRFLIADLSVSIR